MLSVRAYLQLLRPANVVTALADILAGGAIATGRLAPSPALLVSTACLYAGGVVLNDYFDRGLDAVERPERPIPSGRVTPQRAFLLGSALMWAGVVFAFVTNVTAGAVASAIMVAVLAYDWRAKLSAVVGPPTMGLCRGLNLMLGMAVAPDTLGQHVWIALIPFAYIWSVTALSRSEVHGGRVPLIWRPFVRPTPASIRKVVRAGVLGLIVLDAAFATIYAGPLAGLAVLALMPVALGLARLFAVT